MRDISNLVRGQYEGRSVHPEISSIKVNLYTDYEVRAAVAASESVSAEWGSLSYPDCFMVGDSYLMTHLGRTSTRLTSREEQNWFLHLMAGLVGQVSEAVAHSFPTDIRPYIIADLPDGTMVDADSVREATDLLLAHGAEAVKIEVPNADRLRLVESLARSEACVVVHLGYTPQTQVNRTFGVTLTEARSIFHLARQSRDAGACALVIERVAQPINERLCVCRNNGLPVYSIFSGRTRFGGQSLNVWDAVFLPPHTARSFPPTARLHRSTDYPSAYTEEIIRERFARLLALCLAGEFPRRFASNMVPDELEALQEYDPWNGVN